MDSKRPKEVKFITALFPVATLLVLLLVGLLVVPKVFKIAPLPLELLFILAATVAMIQLKRLGYSWESIMESVVGKISKAMPTLLILLAIGIIIGSWIVCGTIPMLVNYGIQMIHPDYIYVISFLVPVVFSTVTGTSWGSVGTIGVVLMGVAISMEAHLPIVAAAIIGGAFFGDKLSPLSDTTNVAALATEIKVYEHIKSMMYTTIPSALIAILIFFMAAWWYPVGSANTETELIQITLSQTAQGFNFSILLLIPPLIVLIGSVKKFPTLPVMMISAFSAIILAFIYQDYSVEVVLRSMFYGFTTESMGFEVHESVANLYNRGGMYAFKEPVLVSVLVFVFVGTIEKIDAMKIIVKRLFGFVKSSGALVRSVLLSTGITNAMTSNQYATSFIVGDAFKHKFDELGLKRSVLSRSLEDTGTMIESLVPWHQSAIYMSATLGVAVADYWYWQVFSLANIVIAFSFATFGVALFRKS